MRKSLNKIAAVFVGCISIPVVAMAVDGETARGYEAVAAQAAVDDFNFQKSSEKIEKLQQKLAELEEMKNTGGGEAEGQELDGKPAAQNRIREAIYIADEIESTKREIEEEQIQKSLNEIRAKSSADQVVRKSSEVDYQSYRINCSIAIKDARIAYLDAAIKEQEEKLKDEEAKLSKGYSTNIEKESISAQLDSLNAQKYTTEREKEVLLNHLNDNGGSYEGFEITTDLPDLETDYYEVFSGVSTKKKEYESQISVYSEYLQNPHDDNDKVMLQLQLVKLQLADYESQLRIYIDEMTMGYETKKNESDAKQGEINVQMKKIETVQKLLEKGKVTKTDMAVENTSLEKLKYEQIQLAGQASIARCILDNQIEGQSLQ